MESFHLPSSLSYNYIPTEATLLKGVETAYILPKEGPKHIFLVYDPFRDLFLRATKIRESGRGETKFTRTKHYLLAIFTSDFVPVGEYFFDFEGSLDLENWFIAKKGLFINKPEQKTEDFYEFWQIDLSTFNQDSEQ
ncbi:MAG: hypothetical protein WD431_03600 [Cyclobacteriaceae bacterium]